MKLHLSGMFISAIVIALVSGCGSSRDVKVSGTFQGATASASSPITVLFYEANGAGDAGTSAGTDLKLVDSIKVEQDGPFDATISMDGSQLTVVAVADTDMSDACTDGEAWGQALVAVQADNTAQVAVAIAAHDKCPALPAE